MLGPIRSMLYVPGSRPDRFAKAMSAGADAVVFDLEDSVEAGQKEKARSSIADFLASPSAGPLRLVRVKAIHSPEPRRAGRARVRPSRVRRRSPAAVRHA
jgi:citrate lyase beta subunit